MLLIVLIALLGLSGLAPIPATAAHTPATGGPYLTANGIIIQAGQSLPIFKLTAPALDGPAVSNLSQQFSNIYAGQAVYSDTYRGLTRFTVPNTSTNSILEQFSATGGFYAYNATQAFSEDVP